MLTWIGVSWRTASSGRRASLRELDALVPGGLAIHTCARDAWLVSGDGSALTDALDTRGFSAEELDSRSDRAAVDRILAVAVGLDSAVQGEADVGRQVRAALGAGTTRTMGVLDHVLARLLRQGRLEGWVREGHGVASLAVRSTPHRRGQG
jgi:glutamyl-tRNA reductase